MATANITIENGLFVRCDGVNYKSFDSRNIVVNGWKCRVEENGNVFCESSYECLDGIHTMRYILFHSGFAKLSLKVPNEPVKIIKMGFVVKKGSKAGNGILGLSGGFIDHRYAFYRDNEFRNFLKEYGITAVLNENPNRIYVLKNGGNSESSFYMKLWTDGYSVSIGTEENLLNAFENAFTGLVDSISVCDSNWVVIQRIIKNDGRVLKNVNLYTLSRDLVNLKGIPNLR